MQYIFKKKNGKYFPFQRRVPLQCEVLLYHLSALRDVV